ncbi:hypothetical protein MBAV_002176 [Candidatus Magnetobacterium bavaricum]|uniref:Uncharacterized protein n=1 Tax=Candidatus Magnetobacterium bavaricum TaxID=29290 RepID=A0A0F3GY39_9BACT|nr:hypothetical protein MBAV_002176 [Candidatus Magnetobacterium bavaricum]
MVRMVTKTITKYEIKEEELKALLPLHPYAAYMLKIISAAISSNQRTMFQFLSGEIGQDKQGRHNFRWYIENHSIDHRCYLTSDYIWDYFFNINNPDLDEGTKSAIIHYDSFENQCGDEGEKRVLKVALLLVAMQKVGGGTTRGIANLLRPTLSNISAAFEGSDIHDKVRITMDQLVGKRILGSMPEGNDILYVTQSHIPLDSQPPVDFPFEKIITDYEVHRHFALSGYAKARFTITCATHVDIKKKLQDFKLLNKIHLVFMFAKSEEDSLKNHDIIIKQLQEYESDIVISDMSSQSLGEQSFNNFIDFKTRAKYFSKIDLNQMKYYENQARGVIDEWIQKLDITTIYLYTKNESSIQLQGNANFRVRIKEVNAKLYPEGLETLTDMDKLFDERGFSYKVPLMGMGKLINIAANFNYLTAIRNKIMEANLWHSHNYAQSNPAHQVSKMKIAIEELINGGFEKSNSIMITDIWRTMQAKPFGLMNCVGSAFLMGFLLKEYADSKFYKHDGLNTVPLSHDALADMIVSIIKDSPKAKDLRIVRMTPGQEIFCNITADVFKIGARNSIQDIVHGMKDYLSKVNFPLWALRKYIEKRDTSELRDTMANIVDLLCEFVSSEKHEGRDNTKIAEDIARFYQRPGIKEYLVNIVTADNMKLGMDIYIEQQRPDIKVIANKLDIGNMGYIKDLKKKLSPDASWLWNKGEIDRKIDEVFQDYKLIDVINRILTVRASTLEDAAHGIKDKIGVIKMPFEFFKGNCSDINPLFLSLIDIHNQGNFKNMDKNAFITEIEQNADAFNAFFDNQYQIFKDNLEVFLKETLSDDQCSHVYKNMESHSIVVPIDQYNQTLKEHYLQYQKSEKFNLLVEKWKELTGTDTPRKWSDNRRIPILCLFKNELKEATIVFSIINKSANPTRKEQIESAIRFLENSQNIQTLSDISKCNEIFKEFISGEYKILFTETDIDDLKGTFQDKLGANIYEWYNLPEKIDAIVKDRAYKKYRESYSKEIFQKIDALPPDKAKDYLKELVKNDPLVGISIMKRTKGKATP